ncbi:LysR substrate-binding domain-containing protein [Denitrobaculum tricleocarpae]|uniref:LysR family transcriptional regulator n=1 Tax=Denitrobaculum tricleocarpae TaxID=2591009 RepID=A0A545T256_9PROT|nr:LysR substrate-binding domain-containing protein [Denitrobaculum tricleocarpae]TQV71300.1 LysR family transcriptional regulator [Denitrobaculum tricleocarpae]
MKDLPLNALRAFAAVYECGGVRPAARLLDIAHSSVSRHLRELEAWLGVELMEKRDGHRSLAFTAAGEALGRSSVASLRDLSAAVTRLREQRKGNGITIETTPSIAARWLLPRLPALEAAHPWIEVSVVVEQRLTALADGGVDFSIRMGNGPWQGFACDPLMDDALYPVVGRSLWNQHAKSLGAGKTDDVRLIHDRDPHAAWQLWQAHYPLAASDLRSGPRFASSDLVLRAAAQSQGMALARDRLARDDVAAGTLIRPFGGQQVTLPDAYWILRDPSTPERVAVTAAIAWLKQEAAA